MRKLILFFTVSVLVVSCAKEYSGAASPNKVLMLQLDYFTNEFEAGKEFTFNKPATTFTISKDYWPPMDIGYIKLKYLELDELLFNGGIFWAGTGKMVFPQDLAPASDFAKTNATDVVKPAAGFELIHDPGNGLRDYSKAWLSAQKLEKVRAYLASNPSATVKLFLYTPGVGAFLDAPKWIMYLKN